MDCAILQVITVLRQFSFRVLPPCRGVGVKSMGQRFDDRHVKKGSAVNWII